MPELPPNFLLMETVGMDYDLLEFVVRFVSNGWSVQTHAYSVRDSLPSPIKMMHQFTESLSGDVCVEFGCGTPHGQIAIRLHPDGHGGRIACEIRLEDMQHGGPTAGWTLAACLLTEPGLLDRFNRQLSQVVLTGEGSAMLEGLV